MKILAKREWKGFFEDGLTQVAQMQMLTLFVWISALILLISSRKYWHVGEYNNGRLLLPAMHLVPWYVGLTERKKFMEASENEKSIQNFHLLLNQTILRLLWVGYVALVVVEYALY